MENNFEEYEDLQSYVKITPTKEYNMGKYDHLITEDMRRDNIDQGAHCIDSNGQFFALLGESDIELEIEDLILNDDVNFKNCLTETGWVIAGYCQVESGQYVYVFKYGEHLTYEQYQIISQMVDFDNSLEISITGETETYFDYNKFIQDDLTEKDFHDFLLSITFKN